VGLFFEKNNPHQTTSPHTSIRPSPPPWLLLAISQPKIKLQNRRSNPTGRQDSTHIAVARRRLSPLFASAQASLWQNWRPDDEGRNGGATMKAAAARRQRQKRWRNDEGSGGATISSGAMMKAMAARRRRQNRRCNDEGSGGASMKLAAA
jgi:hypothetical protein